MKKCNCKKKNLCSLIKNKCVLSIFTFFFILILMHYVLVIKKLNIYKEIIKKL